jgi:hypothetical protein
MRSVPGPRRELLQRIDDELALAKALPGLPAAIAARGVVALEGGSAERPTLARLRPSSFAGVPDRAVHAIAAVATATLERDLAGRDEVAIEASARAALGAWAELATRRRYLAELAGPILGASHAAAPTVAAGIGLDRVVAALRLRAEAGLDLGGLLRALRDTEAAPADVGRRAARARLDAIDLVLEPLRRTLDELATRRPAIGEIVAAFTAIRDAWRRTDRDIDLEVLAVERLPDFAWDFYRDRKLDELGRLVDTITELGSSLAVRVERDPTAIAWAAPCAQLLVFRAELAPRFDTQIELAERAYAVCPTLRNARLVLGDFLLTRAERAIDRGAARTTAGTTPADDVERAATLNADLKRLPGIRAKLGRRSA